MLQAKTVLELPWHPPRSLPRPPLRPHLSISPNRPCLFALHLHYQTPTLPTPPHHTFTTTSSLYKKGGKEKRNADTASNPSSSTKTTSAAGDADNNPFDTSALETSIQKAVDKLKDDLSKLRAGRRFNPELLEGLRVQPVKGSKESVRLGELAQVLPRGGRSVVLVVAEREHLKPITTSLLASPYSLTPLPPDPQNPTHITVPIPPPTRDARLEALQTVTKAGEQAGAAVRAARAVMQKRLRGMGVAKSVRPDDLRRAGEGMEKVVERGVGDVKGVVEGARRVLGASDGK